MRIIMNQYERENIERIKSEIRAYEGKNGKMPKEKMAYYIYNRMGQSYLYKEAYIHTQQRYAGGDYRDNGSGI